MPDGPLIPCLVLALLGAAGGDAPPAEPAPWPSDAAAARNLSRHGCVPLRGRVACPVVHQHGHHSDWLATVEGCDEAVGVGEAPCTDAAARARARDAVLRHFREKGVRAEAFQHRATFARARPFAHAVLENIFPEAALRAIDREWPERVGAACDELSARGWHCRRGRAANSDESAMGPAVAGALAALRSPIFVLFLEALTGIAGLQPDPANFGGGQHVMLRNSSLPIHADFNLRHVRGSLLHRRVGAILFLNARWDTRAWGGALELWARDMRACEARIAPERNRLVVFAGTDFTYHGVAEPLRCPPERARRSLVMYYYTARRPADEALVVEPAAHTKPHAALFQKRRCAACSESQCHTSQLR